MDVAEYVKIINTRYQTGIAREHSYRGDLQNLIHSLLPMFLITNEPARIACGAPDYILTQKSTKIDIGYIEAKDVGKSLDDKNYLEQFTRYKKSLTNLIITDYLEFRLYREGEFVASVQIAELKNKKVQPVTSAFENFKQLIVEFSNHVGEPITSPSRLAEMMAGKARLLANVIELALNSDEDNNENTTLQDQMQSFKMVLLHDLDAKGFSDIYAQTIAYGMFAARLHDSTPKSFSRQEAAQLIPQTNPFLRKLFQYISGYDIDSRIEWIVDALAEVFRLTDVGALLVNFGKAGKQSDPMIHFYEEFLSEYDPALRRSRGVWYTPEPVVRFITAAVDQVLKSEFGLSQGLADTSKTTIKLNSQIKNKKSKTGFEQIETSVHKVQILDPATGTGTFLAEIVRRIHNNFDGQAGAWSKYVEEHLIPRLNGFEILMASYAMAHLKLDLLLRETAFKPKKLNRFQIYLTNSLEEYHPDTGTLFASWLSAEANEANHIKRDTPVMVVLGNPPYSRHSINKGHWLGKLLDSYKKEPGTNQRLDERNSKWLNDDYVKFMRYAQHFVEKAGFGIVAFITNHGYIDNPTFRGMRWSLLDTFDCIHVIDLHGNSNVEEFVPSGLENENVFDIKQGVAITIAVRTNQKKKELAKVFHHDVYGTREEKYSFLKSNTLKSIKFDQVELKAPFFFFKPKKYNKAAKYDAWPSLSKIFTNYSTGYYTSCDDVVIAADDGQLKSQVSESGLVGKYEKSKVRRTAYRPFDFRKIYFDEKLLTRARKKFVDAMPSSNVILISGKSTKNASADHFYISDVFSELKCGESSKGSYMFPLYFESEGGSGSFLPDGESNIDSDILSSYRVTCGKSISPKCVVFYIYAILSSTIYKEQFKENLRDDFAHIPPPKDKKSFTALAKAGERLFNLHRLEPACFDKLITEYPIDGGNIISNSIGKADWKAIGKNKDLGRIWINGQQYFDKVPLAVWEYQIGGYIPAQKWLKDRRELELSYEDIVTYQRIVGAINETMKIVEEINKTLDGYF
jgi:predicted helicase